MGRDGEFDSVLARVVGPLSIEVAQLDDDARHRWEAYAAVRGWQEVDWFDMPGAFAWRREPPGVWELTWQQTADMSEMVDLRLLPPDHSLVWRRQLVDLVREFGTLLGRAITLVDESTAMPVLDFDPADGEVHQARRTLPTPMVRPPGEQCCAAMRRQFTEECDICVDAYACPHQLLYYIANTGDYALPVRDGGSSYVAIKHCPWCGAGVPGAASHGDPG